MMLTSSKGDPVTAGSDGGRGTVNMQPTKIKSRGVGGAFLSGLRSVPFKLSVPYPRLLVLEPAA